MTPLTLLLSIASMILFSGCDTIALGYINKLDHRIIIRENGGGLEHPITLALHQRIDPGFGSNPKSIDLFSSSDALVASYRIRDLPHGVRDTFQYVVISQNGVFIRARAEALKDEPNAPQ